jgi:hypothetical protein
MNKAEQVFEKLSQWSSPTKDFWNDSILQNIDYARYVTKHKYNLGSAGVKIGLSPGKILAHDWSKFKPNKFDVYEDFFFGPEGIRSGKASPTVYKSFRKEVEDHYRTESHHNDRVGLPENLQTELESVADWYSVGKTNADMKGLDFPNFVDWWNSRKNFFLMKGDISREAYEQIEKTLAKDYNIITYTVDKIKELFK